jgi:hypothetical protein
MRTYHIDATGTGCNATGYTRLSRTHWICDPEAVPLVLYRFVQSPHAILPGAWPLHSLGVPRAPRHSPEVAQ